MKKSKKRTFSLIEITICLFLIAVVGSLLGMKGYSLIERTRFDAAISKVKNNFKECRQLASLHGEDIIYIFEEKEKELHSSKGFEGGVLSEENFSNISLTLDDRAEAPITFRFSSTGAISPLGKVELFSSNRKHSQTIDLKDFFQWEEKYK